MKKISLFIMVLLVLALIGCTGAVTISGIEVDSSTIPSNVTVEEFDLTDMKITVKYSDNTTKSISLSDSMISDADKAKLETAGTHEITINYEAFSIKISITLEENAPKTYTITFKAEGSADVTKVVNIGSILTDVPTVPAKEGYTGVWDVTDFSTVTADKTVNAVYTINTYKVTFKAEGSADVVKNVEYKATLTDVPAVPAKEGYTGVWDVTDFSNITADKTVNAVYTINTLTVTFKAEGSADVVKNINYNGTLTDIPAVPEKVGFDGVWDTTVFTGIKENKTVNAVYTIKTFTITFKAEGSADVVKTVNYDATLTDVPAVPEKVGYTGVWDTTVFANVKENKTVNAVYTINTFTVTFKAEGSADVVKTVNYDATLADVPAVPEKVGFDGVWDTTVFTNIKENKTVNAVYTVKKFTITFKAEGSADVVKTVNYDETLTDIPAVPTRVGYDVVAPEWDTTEFTNIKENKVVNAVYTINTFIVVFKDYDGTILSSSTVNYNEDAVAPTVPARAGYAFNSWDKAFTAITANTVVTASYDAATNYINVTSSTGSKGGQIVIFVEVLGNVNFCNYNMFISYNTTDLELVTVENVDINSVIGNETGKIKFNFSQITNVNAEKTLLKITFNILSTTTATSSNLDLTVVSMNKMEANYIPTAIANTIVNGIVTIK